MGGRFYDEIEHLVAEVCSAPHRFRRIDADVRRHLAGDFPYALLYLDEPAQVWIIALMPLRRDPDYWKHRLTNGVLLFAAVLGPPQQRQIAKDIGLTVEESPERR